MYASIYACKLKCIHLSICIHVLYMHVGICMYVYSYICMHAYRSYICMY